DRPVAFPELFLLLPGGRGPDVFRMRRKRPRQASQQCRIPRDRGWRVQEMRVEPRHVRRQLAREHQRLTEATDAVGREVAPEIAQEFFSCAAVSWEATARAPAPDHAERLAPEIFREIEDACDDLRMDRMELRVGRM